ncbi:hepatocyte growth factor-regulated tyrosine kinase substrate-like isoform X1 [Haliotis cracherodii]|uniref:hepatocyte growth factor-regulated tyrosine kinase substrate-like isoform X1 n=1 Tax=Haliotis cracherodii TaxID=6455 RepID=UPI0039EA0CD5
MFSSKSATFDRALEKATSQLLLEPDWDSILQLCDSVRQADVTPKYAALAIRKKIQFDNPHVSLFALQVLESCMKNCGSLIHGEVATKEFMEFMKDQAKTKNDPVKAKILEMVQVWSHAFRNEPSYKVVQDTFHLMKMEGYKFPQLKEADAMFAAEKAPEWKDSDVCTRCRVAFGMVQRKHHCRNCGEVFCSKCSSKSSIIPRFGIEREVRVCDACFDKLNKPTAKAGSDELPPEYLASPLSKQPQQNPTVKTEQELQEEEELQLALALSKSEHETKEKERERLRHNYSLYSGDERSSSPQSGKNAQMSQPPAAVTSIDTSDMDPELARYLNRNYWQQKSEHQAVTSTTTPSAPVVTTEPKTSTVKTQEQIQTYPPYQNGETDEDQAQFLNALNSSIEIFVNRMRSNSQRGRSIANDSSVQSLFAVISNMHPQLMKYIQEQEDLRSHYESLQDKLAQLRDAREALDALREEHREKRRREMEELERQRQIQMAQKLEIMRQKKHEYLEMQRQLALQRLQEQEREMQMRFEQQKHLTQMRQMQAYGYPQGMPQQMYGQMPPQGVPGQMPPQGMPPQGPPHLQQQGPPHGFSPVGSTEGSPVHQTGGYNQQGPNMMPPGGGAPPAQGMYMPPNTQQAYTQAGPPNIGYAPPQASMAGGGANLPGGGATIPGGYQAHLPSQTQTDGGQMAGPPQGNFVPGPGGVGYPDQGPASMPPQMPPSGGQQAPAAPAYASMQPNMEYNTYNMQNMSGALPQQNQAVYNNPQQPYMGPPPPQGQFQGGAPPQQMPPQNQPPPHQENEASLISFD